ncbi:MAG: tRNA glutamyl-Q(34) synthetase GluQRS [Gammaproteobacteria bacterium]
MAAEESTGRFAPSPTGPLHFGSVTSAAASWLEARAGGGRWLLRIDDLDPPREEPGAADLILATLEALALTWDGAVVFQSTRAAAYAAALDELARADHLFPCACTRREVGSGPYPGTCRDGLPAGREARSLRVRIEPGGITVADRVQGTYTQELASACGDFIVRRADGLVAYHLAAVVDDAAAGVTDVVRGADLLESTPRQIFLQRLLGLPQPRYAHLPVVVDAAGNKLSKQTGAPPVTPADAPAALYQALDFLGLAPPAELAGAPPASLLEWALPRWRLDACGAAPRPYPRAASNMSRSVS